ncbi:MAG: transcription initiation factor IIB [Thaumarchaeota archaeon]|nr:transcription initiation factor IIB [Nitrososphaerota archaeon]
MFNKCEEIRCKKGPVITDNVSGEEVCSRCGLVLMEKIESSGPEYTTYDLSEFMTKTRSGAGQSLAMFDMGLPTIIDSINRDASGNSLSSYMKNTFGRLRVWDNRSKSKLTSRGLMRAVLVLNKLKAELGIPDVVIEKAAYLYRKAMISKITMGRSSASMTCASLYAACRETDTPRTLNDIARVGNITRKDISKSYRNLIKTLDLRPKPYDSSEFITRISSEVGISEKTRRNALDLLSKVVEKEISAGKNPMGLAAAVLYLSCVKNDERKKQADIANASGITAVTIRNRVESLRKELGLKN